MLRRRWKLVLLVLAAVVAVWGYNWYSRRSGAPPGAVLVDLGHNPTKVRWCKNGDHLYFVTLYGSGRRLCRYELKAKRTEVLAFPIGLHGYDVSPDDSRVAISADAGVVIHDLATARKLPVVAPFRAIAVAWLSSELVALNGLPISDFSTPGNPMITSLLKLDGTYCPTKGLIMSPEYRSSDIPRIAICNGPLSPKALSLIPSSDLELRLLALEQNSGRTIRNFLYFTSRVAAYHTVSARNLREDKLQIVDLRNVKRVTVDLPGLTEIASRNIAEGHFSPDLSKYYLVNWYKGRPEVAHTDGIWICKTPPKVLAKLRETIKQADEQ